MTLWIFHVVVCILIVSFVDVVYLLVDLQMFYTTERKKKGTKEIHKNKIRNTEQK